MSDTLLKNRSIRLTDPHVEELKKEAARQKRDWTELVRLFSEEGLERSRKRNGRARK